MPVPVFREEMFCAPMPALILFDSDKFIPLWRLSGAIITGNRVCIPVPSGHRHGILRTGRGWGRRSNETYYLVDFEKKSIVKLKRVAVKKPGGGWLSCVRLRTGLLCFEWVDGSIRAIRRALLF